MNVKEKIIRESVRLFGESGYQGTSLDVIAESVGIRKQSLLHYFNSKAELRKAVMADLMVHWQKELPRLMAEASSGYGRFADTIGAFVSFLLDDTNRAKLAVREMLDRPEETHLLIAEQLKPWTTLVVNYIKNGQRAGIVRTTVDPESYLIMVMIMAISAVSIGSVASAMTETAEDSAPEARIKELIRIAHDSLFIEKTDKQEK